MSIRCCNGVGNENVDLAVDVAVAVAVVVAVVFVINVFGADVDCGS